MTRQVLLCLVSLGCIIGCTSATANPPSPLPLPEAAQEPATPQANTENRGRTWRIIPTAELETYRSTLKTTITERNNGENQQTSFTTTVDYSLSLVRSSNSVRASGSVSAFQIQADQATQPLPEGFFVLPISFDGSISDHDISLHSSGRSRSSALAQCSDSSQTVLSTVNRDLIVVPGEMTADQSWQDSSSSSLCTGSLPVAVSVIRSYRVTGETLVDGIPALKLERTEKLVTSGEGSQGQHQITINGAGTGKAQIYIDRSSGLLLTLAAKNQVELVIKSSGRVQNFTQISEENVVKISSR